MLYKKQKFTRIFGALMMACLNGCAWAGAEAADAVNADPVDFSFVFFGCNRLDSDEAGGAAIPSTANAAQLKQDLLDIAALQPRPQYLFLAGDVVLGLPKFKADEKPDDKKAVKDLSDQLAQWRLLLDQWGKEPAIHDLLKDTKLVVFTGNHELLKKVPDPFVFKGGKNETVEVPNPPAYGFWQDQIIGQWEKAAWPVFIVGNDGPGKGDDKLAPYRNDHLLDSEKRLSYTLTLQSPAQKKYFFVILNTDSLVDDHTLGDIPLQWASEKLAAAQKDADIHDIFVMGHKPIIAPADTDDPAVAKSINAYQAEDLYALLNNPGLVPPADGKPPASKVRAYLAAHSHQWNYQSALAFDSIKNGTVPQVVAGNGGSPPEKGWQTNGYFGFTLVSVTVGGTVNLKSYGRPIPAPYNQQTGIQPAGLIVSEDIYTPPAPSSSSKPSANTAE